MLNGIQTKKAVANIDKEAFIFLHKEMLRQKSTNLAGEQLFDVEKYIKVSEVKFSKKGMPEDIVFHLKKEVDGRIISEGVSLKNTTKSELKDALMEHNRLS